MSHRGFPSTFLYLLRYSAVSELSPDVLSGGGRCLFYCAQHFRTANSTPLISISRNIVPFAELSWKAITQKCLFQSSAPIYLWAPARSKIVDPTRQAFLGCSSWRRPGDMTCTSKKSALVISVERLNGKALKEAGRWNTVAIFLSDGNTAHGSSASVMGHNSKSSPVTNHQ
jgi:hypothetical protein